MARGSRSADDPFGILVDAIGDFLPLFNDRFASIFPAAGRKAQPLTKSQVGVLILLHKGKCATATELGPALNLTKAGLTSILDALEAKRLLRRSADPRDRRKARLALTETGARTAASVIRSVQDAVAARVNGLSAADQSALTRHLTAAARILRRI